MDQRTFQAAVWELSLFFERKLPGDETIRQWADAVGHIPGGHVREIISEIKKGETWPKNLPAMFVRHSCLIAEKNGENNQYAVHPRRLKPQAYAKIECKQCSGSGLIPWPMDWPVRRDESGQMITRKFTPQALCPCTDSAEYGF